MTVPTRAEIAKILSDIGKPGEKRDEKLKAIQALELKNSQGHGVEETLESYVEW